MRVMVVALILDCDGACSMLQVQASHLFSLARKSLPSATLLACTPARDCPRFLHSADDDSTLAASQYQRHPSKDQQHQQQFSQQQQQQKHKQHHLQHLQSQQQQQQQQDAADLASCQAAIEELLMDRFSPHSRLVRRQLPGIAAAGRRALQQRGWRVVSIQLSALEEAGAGAGARAGGVRSRDVRRAEAAHVRTETLLRQVLALQRR